MSLSSLKENLKRAQENLRICVKKQPKPYSVPETRAGKNRAARLELAAAYRALNNVEGVNEGICNHLTVMAPRAEGEGEVMLVYPYTLHWAEVTASNLVGIDSNCTLIEGTMMPDVAALSIHIGIRRVRPDAKVIMHTHMYYATALACMEDPTMKMLHQNSARFYKRISYDTEYQGLALTLEEGEKMGKVLGDSDVLFLGNHGVVVVAETIALAFEKLYYLERASKLQVLCEAMHRPIRILTDAQAKLTFDQFEADKHTYANAFFYSMYRMLQKSDPQFQE